MKGISDSWFEVPYLADLGLVLVLVFPKNLGPLDNTSYKHFGPEIIMAWNSLAKKANGSHCGRID